MMGRNGLKEFVVCVGGCVRLVLVYIPVAKKFVKVFPSNNNGNNDYQPEIVAFDEEKGFQILRNYENIKNATIIAREFRGFKNYSNVRADSIDIKLNNLFNGQKVCITA